MRQRITYHARLIPVWERWVVEIPEANGVHAPVSDPSEALEVARAAIATVLGLEPRTFDVVMERVPS